MGADYKDDQDIQCCLVNALVDLMKEYPFDDITISEICYKAHVARATYYRYASGKHGKEYLLAFKLKNDYSKYLDIHNMQMGEHILGYVYENKELFTLLQKNKLLNVIVSFLKFANQNDKMKAVNPYLHAYSNFSYLGVIYQWVKDDFSKTPAEISMIIFNAYKKIVEDLYNPAEQPKE